MPVDVTHARKAKTTIIIDIEYVVLAATSPKSIKYEYKP
jgi:regulator of extracellular matrix RemA (YlzA/DUF370 family)